MFYGENPHIHSMLIEYMDLNFEYSDICFGSIHGRSVFFQRSHFIQSDEKNNSHIDNLGKLK